MEKAKEIKINYIVYAILGLYITRHVFQIITNIFSLMIAFSGVIIYNICISCIMIAILILILNQKKYALFAFFGFQVFNAITISAIDGDWMVHFFVAALACAILSVILLIRENGISAWKAILQKKEVPEPDKEKEMVEEEQLDSHIPNPFVSEHAYTGSDPIAVIEEQNFKEAKKTQFEINEKNIIIPNSHKSNAKLLIILVIGFVIIASVLYILYIENSNSTEKNISAVDTIKTSNVGLDKYIYVDKGGFIHTRKDCKAIYKKDNAQAVDIVSVRHVWVPNGGLENICSQCVTYRQIHQLDSISSTVAYDSRKWLYKILKEEYHDTNDWKTFNRYIDDKGNLKSIYDVVKNDYDLVDFELFYNSFNDYKTSIR